MLIQEWIYEQTSGSKSVLELGAGFFDKLGYCAPSVERFCGIEAFYPYIQNAKLEGPAKICGDMLDWRILIPQDWPLDTVMLIDSLEHVDKDSGRRLLDELQGVFERVLVFTPDGFHPQQHDETGYGNDLQVHRCGWTRKEVEDLGFRVQVHPEMSPTKPSGMLTARWDRPEHKILGQLTQ